MHNALRHIFAAAAIAATLSSCSVSEPYTVPQEINAELAREPFVPGIVSVRFTPEMTARVEEALRDGDACATKAIGDDILADMGIKSLRRVFPYAGEWEERTRKEGMHCFYYVEFDPEQPVTKASAGLRDLPGVVSVTPQFKVQRRAAFYNDPYFTSQWHYVNSRYKGADINVQKVWEEFTKGSPNVIVSVVDEGVYMEHEDLAGNLIPCYEDGSGSFNFNNGTPTVVPTQGHGTHVAGIISAVSNNGIGVAGVAGGDAAAGIEGVKVMSCQIFDLYGNQPDLFQAIKHGADHGAVILQCSWGFSPDMDGDGFTTEEEVALYRSYTINDLPEYKAAIDYFIKYAGCDNDGNQLPGSPMKGGVAIFASGNDNFDYDPLVSYEPIIAVGAFGFTGAKASYSNYGDWIDVAAPGGEIKSGIYSTLTNNAYGGTDWIGTSMACPHVSAVAALLVSYFGGPGFTADECRTRIIRGAVPNAFTDSRHIGRRLDAYGSFTYDMDTPAAAPTLAWAGELPTEIAHNLHVEVPFTVTDPLDLEVKVELDKKYPGVGVVHDYTDGWRLAIDADKLGVGEYSIGLTGTNDDNLKSSISMSFTVTNAAPAIQADKIPENITVGGADVHFEFDADYWFRDPEGDELTLFASLDNPSLAVISVKDNRISVTGKKAGCGTLTVSASDGAGQAKVQLPFAVYSGSYDFAYIESNRVSDKLVLHLENEDVQDVPVSICSGSGAMVWKATVQASIFTPVEISTASFAPGQYTLRAGSATLRFVKL